MHKKVCKQCWHRGFGNAPTVNTFEPSNYPSYNPTKFPTYFPTEQPTIDTLEPTYNPTMEPTIYTSIPTSYPTLWKYKTSICVINGDNDSNEDSVLNIGGTVLINGIIIILSSIVLICYTNVT